MDEPATAPPAKRKVKRKKTRKLVLEETGPDEEEAQPAEKVAKKAQPCRGFPEPCRTLREGLPEACRALPELCRAIPELRAMPEPCRAIRQQSHPRTTQSQNRQNLPKPFEEEELKAVHPSPSRHLHRDDTIRYTTHYYDAEREDAQDPFAYELELAVDKLSTPKKPLPEPSNKPLSPRSEKGASGPSKKPSPKQKTPRKSLDRMFEKAAKGKGCGAALLALPAPPKAEADMSLWGALGHLVILLMMMLKFAERSSACT